LRVYCKRTFFEKNWNSYPINGKEYGQDWAKWIHGKFYNFRVPQNYEKEVGVYYIIESERESFWSPIKIKDFNKHFIDIDQLRQEKIDRLLGNSG
jgi:uncharacterized lipoprotein YddW (UPF0748 family)